MSSNLFISCIKMKNDYDILSLDMSLDLFIYILMLQYYMCGITYYFESRYTYLYIHLACLFKHSKSQAALRSPSKCFSV